jgi:hypothetical protein
MDKHGNGKEINMIKLNPDYTDTVRTQVWTQVWNQVRNQVWNQVWDQINDNIN